MATFQQNLAKIRGEAIYGPEMRTAIADAIEQADDQIQPQISTYEAYVDNGLTLYKDSVDASVEQVSSRLNTVQAIIDDHLFYIQVEQIGATNDYVVSITEGESA